MPLTGFPRLTLLHRGDPARLRTVEQGVRALGFRLEHVADPEAASALEADVAVVIDEALTPEERARALRPERVPAVKVLLLSPGLRREELGRLFGSGALTHLVPLTDDLRPSELLVPLRRMTGAGLFGIERAFPWGCEWWRHTARSSKDKDAVLAWVEAHARDVGVEGRLLASLCHVADELFTNAVFNAPVDAAGAHLHARRAREEAVTLAPGEEVTVALGSDGMRLGLSVTDPFGSLAPDQVLRYLAKGLQEDGDRFDDKAGGAGLGLSSVFQSLSQLSVSVARGRRTEVSGWIDVRGTYKEFAARPKGFHLYAA